MPVPVPVPVPLELPLFPLILQVSETISTLLTLKVFPDAALEVRHYRTFDDLYGRPVMMLRVDVPREITLRGYRAVTYASACLIAAAMIVSVSPAAFWYKGCVAGFKQEKHRIEQEKTERTENSNFFSVSSVCSC